MTDKTYFKNMLRYKLLQQLEIEQTDIGYDLDTVSAQNNDKEYRQYLKNKFLAYTDLIHYVAEIWIE